MGNAVLVRMGTRGFAATSRFGKRVEELKDRVLVKYGGWMRVVEMRALRGLGTPVVGYSTCVTSVIGSECLGGPSSRNVPDVRCTDVAAAGRK